MTDSLFSSLGHTPERHVSEGGFRSFYHRFGLVFVLEGAAAFRRGLDLLFALGVLTVLSPLWLGILVLVARRRGSLLTRIPMIGRWCEPYFEFRFDVPPGPTGAILHWLHLDRFPRLLNLLRGDLSLIGPRSLDPSELTPALRLSRAHFDVRPGLIQLVWIRDSRFQESDTPLQKSSNEPPSNLRHDLQTMIRAFPTILYTGGALWAPAQVNLLGLGLDNLTVSEAVQAIENLLVKGSGGQVALITSEHATIAHQDTAYREVLGRAEFRLASSRTLQLAAKIQGQELRAFITPEMLLSRLLGDSPAIEKRLFLLGHDEKSFALLVHVITHRWPQVKVCGFAEFPRVPTEEDDLPMKIRASGANLLLAGVPAPALEVWLDRRRKDLFPILAIGLGSWFADNIEQASNHLPQTVEPWETLGLTDLWNCWHQPSGACSLRFLASATLLVRVFLERAGRRSPAPRFEIPKF